MVKEMNNVQRIDSVRVSPAFARAFARVHAAFQSTPEEIQAAKAAARERMVSAEDAYYAAAELIEAGWNPLAEQAKAFMVRTGCTSSPRWPTVPAEHVEMRWPPKMRKAA